MGGATSVSGRLTKMGIRAYGNYDGGIGRDFARHGNVHLEVGGIGAEACNLLQSSQSWGY